MVWGLRDDRATVSGHYRHRPPNRQPMTPANLLLILGSACIHVVAHVALKRSTDRAAFVWWMMLWGSVLFAPLVVTAWPVLPPWVLVVMLFSAGFEALYFAS